jgi:hypothetical protein
MLCVRAPLELVEGPAPGRGLQHVLDPFNAGGEGASVNGTPPWAPCINAKIDDECLLSPTGSSRVGSECSRST